MPSKLYGICRRRGAYDRGGDAAFKIGVGSGCKAAAADGYLAGANDDDIGGEISVHGPARERERFDKYAGRGQRNRNGKDLNLNWSGTAATISINSTIGVTGTITVLVADLGDD